MSLFLLRCSSEEMGKPRAVRNGVLWIGRNDVKEQCLWTFPSSPHPKLDQLADADVFEVVLGVDNIVFISITTNRLAPEHQHIGRKLGLLGAMISRCIFLCFASYLVHMTKPLFTLDLGFFQHAFNVRDLVLLAGGAYLIYKGIDELRDVLALTEEKAAHLRGA